MGKNGGVSAPGGEPPALAAADVWGWLVRRPLLTAGPLALFGLAFVAQLVVERELAAGAVLLALPIALVAVAFGAECGLAAAALALLLFAAWDQLQGVGASPLAYLTRGLAFALLGGLVGWFAERLRQSTRRWHARPRRLRWQRSAAGGRAPSSSGLARLRSPSPPRGGS